MSARGGRALCAGVQRQCTSPGHRSCCSRHYVAEVLVRIGDTQQASLSPWFCTCRPLFLLRPFIRCFIHSFIGSLSTQEAGLDVIVLPGKWL